MNDLAPITQMFNSVNAEKQNEIVDHIYSKISSVNPPLHDICENINRKSDIICPECKKSHFYLNGKHKGLQTYKCKKCGRRFNAFSGTSIAYLKKKDLLKPFIKTMLLGAGLKECTKQLPICIQTAFDWRHKILAPLSKDVPKYFSEIVEMIEYKFSFSRKGQGAKARKIGQKGEINEESDTEKKKKNRDPVSAVIISDRNNSFEFKVIKQGKPSNADLKKEFSSKLKNIKRLCIEDDIIIQQFAIGKKISYHISENGKRVKGKTRYLNTKTSRRILFNLLFWMERFKGVSSTYLQNYLYWFMLSEQIKHEIDFTSSFIEQSLQARDGKQRYKKCRMFDS